MRLHKNRLCTFNGLRVGCNFKKRLDADHSFSLALRLCDFFSFIARTVLVFYHMCYTFMCEYKQIKGNTPSRRARMRGRDAAGLRANMGGSCGPAWEKRHLIILVVELLVEEVLIGERGNASMHRHARRRGNGEAGKASLGDGNRRVRSAEIIWTKIQPDMKCNYV